jgi:DNA-binding NtrC family response regulator
MRRRARRGCDLWPTGPRVVSSAPPREPWAGARSPAEQRHAAGRPGPAFAVTQNRILPYAGPALTLYLLADASATGLRWDPSWVAIAAVAVLCSLVPALLKPTMPRGESQGLGRAGVLGASAGVALAARIGDGMPSMVAELVGAVATVAFGAVLVDLALTVPDRPRRIARLSPLVVASAFVAGGMGFVAPLPELTFFGRLFLAPSATFSKAPVAFMLGAIVVASLLRLLRSKLGSTPAALASNAWALLGLLPSVVVLAALVLVRHRGLVAEDSVWIPATGAFVAVVVSYAHAALVDPSRRLMAGDAARRAIAATATLAGVAVVVLPLRSEIPDEPAALVAACGAILGLGSVLYRAALPLSRRLFAPFGARLLDASERAIARIVTGASLEELVERVLGTIREGSGDPSASGRLFTIDPPTDSKIDAAGQPHVTKREIPAALAARFAEYPGEVIVLADLAEHVVRKPALRPLVEALEQLEAICAVPIMSEGELEGALVVPRGRRVVPLRLEEITALSRLADRLAGPVRVFGALARAQARANATLLEKDRADERAEALEDEIARLSAAADALRAGRGMGTIAQAVVAYSAGARDVERRIEDVAPTEACVSLVAEAGCFVDRIARRIHEASPREAGPFISFDLGYVAADDTLGALVGASGERESPGLLRLANGGTLLLVDVPALSTEAQRALADALAVHEARPIDGAGAYPADVRLVATSRVPLGELVAAGVFDAELARWLAPVELVIPPLRERPEDIPSLTLLAIDRACRVLGRPPLGIEQDAMDLLLASTWPGNQRELELVIGRAVAAAEGPQIRARDLPPLAVAAPEKKPDAEAEGGGDPLAGTAVEVERRMLTHALERAGGNKSEAARLLGMKRTTFLDKLRRHELATSDGGRSETV